MAKIRAQEILDGSAVIGAIAAGAEAVNLVDLPPVAKIIAYGLVVASVISHILKSDHGVNSSHNVVNIGGDRDDGPNSD